jgi:hypothetical protein
MVIKTKKLKYTGHDPGHGHDPIFFDPKKKLGHDPTVMTMTRILAFYLVNRTLEIFILILFTDNPS